MLLCKEQQNPIVFEGRNICISAKAANAYYFLCDAPVDEGAVKMYLEFFLKGDTMSTLSNEELTQILEDGVKREFLDILTEEEWDAIPG